MRPHDIVFMIYSVMIDGRKRSMLKIRVTMLHILRLLLGRKGCHGGSCMYGRSIPVRRSRGRERADEYWDGNDENKKTSLTYRISYPIETYTFYKL